ncbi:MAG: zf-HC2 domain-containing protein [Bryobacteraceae bacterium]
MADNSGVFYDSHPSLDALELHLLRRLSEEESARIEAHLFSCNECGVMTSELKGQMTLINAAFACDGESELVREY